MMVEGLKIAYIQIVVLICMGQGLPVTTSLKKVVRHS